MDVALTWVGGEGAVVRMWGSTEASISGHAGTDTRVGLGGLGGGGQGRDRAAGRHSPLQSCCPRMRWPPPWSPSRRRWCPSYRRSSGERTWPGLGRGVLTIGLRFHLVGERALRRRRLACLIYPLTSYITRLRLCSPPIIHGCICCAWRACGLGLACLRVAAP